MRVTEPPRHGDADTQPSAKAAMALALDSRQCSEQFRNHFDGYHTRIVRLFLRSRRPQLALEYVAQLPLIRKVHGSLLHEISKHGDLVVLQAALQLRQLMGLSMDKCAAQKFQSSLIPHPCGAWECDDLRR
jgi:hypothetical protein